VTYLDVLTNEIRNLIGVDTFLVDRARRHLFLSNDTFSNSDTVIVVTKSGSLVNDTGTGSVGNISVGDDLECSIGVLFRSEVETRSATSLDDGSTM